MKYLVFIITSLIINHIQKREGMIPYVKSLFLSVLPSFSLVLLVFLNMMLFYKLWMLEYSAQSLTTWQGLRLHERYICIVRRRCTFNVLYYPSALFVNKNFVEVFVDECLFNG